MKRVVVIAGLVAFALSGFAGEGKPTNETPLPDPAKGYRWERFTEVQSAFLCPVGCHRFHKAAAMGHTYVLSKESVKDEGSFETGMTLQVIKGIMEKKGMPPSVAAIGMSQTVLEKKENKKQSVVDLSSGPFKAFGMRYRNAPKTAKPIIVYQVFVANDKMDTLFVVTFEAPEATWDTAWELGEPMIKKFMIDDAY